MLNIINLSDRIRIICFYIVSDFMLLNYSLSFMKDVI